MIKIINGVEYEKSNFDEFWTAEPNGINPGVICDCGNKEFTLSYGSWEIIAHCTKCGKSDTVYSG